MNPYDEIRLIAATLYKGEQRASEICPFCRGGRSGDKSLSIRRVEGGAVYWCPRANCGRSGRVQVGGEGFAEGAHIQYEDEFKPRIFDGVIEEIPDVISEYYIAKYGFTQHQWDDPNAGIGWSTEYQRTVWQVVAPTGACRGYELRSHRPSDWAKTLPFRHSPDPWVGYYLHPPRRPNAGSLVAVEDVISAYKVHCAGFDSCSIMGSHLNLEVLLDLMKYNDETITLCLDRDATKKALGFAKRFAFVCPSLRCIPIQRDLKYETSETINQILSPT